jgi:hypothetical protein
MNVKTSIDLPIIPPLVRLKNVSDKGEDSVQPSLSIFRASPASLDSLGEEKLTKDLTELVGFLTDRHL